MLPLILFYLVLTIIRPQDYLAGLASVPLLPLVLVLALVTWLGSRHKTFAAPHFYLLPVFLLALMMSEIANHWIGGAIEQFSDFSTVVVAFFILATATSVGRRELRLALGVLVLCACVLALHGVDQTRYGVGWTGMTLSEGGRIQYVGIFNDPNDLGLLFVTALPMAIYLRSLSGFLMRQFWLAGAGLLVYGIYLTNSRGAMLALLVEGGVYVWMRRGMITAGVLGVIGLSVMKLLSSRMQELDADEDSAMGRVDAWYEGLHMFTSHPLFGVGAGNFTDYNYLTAHNSFVLVLAETGLFGYITWLAFVGYSFWLMLAIVRHQPPGTADAIVVADAKAEKALATTLLLSLCGMFAAAFFLSRSYTIILYLVIAVVVGQYVGARKRLPGLRAVSLAASWWVWIPAALGSIVFFFLLVAVLLHSA
ncbi:O-antigen ligase family protein [Dyella sp.]|jgi:O-antigen ligase|uniref:O-antigen ligase family protein n=1 Tax=Dyella sp. TaxID=1869338 RepID=UPI002D79850C|nr:O-antigen ligase family protein [Dyella sp.]HET6432957.1 O-antigen ligase family protein [Dyella sp.]